MTVSFNILVGMSGRSTDLASHRTSLPLLRKLSTHCHKHGCDLGKGKEGVACEGEHCPQVNPVHVVPYKVHHQSEEGRGHG